MKTVDGGACDGRPHLTQEMVEAAYAGEVEFVATSKIVTVTGIEKFRCCCLTRCHGVDCSHCGLHQKQLNHHCVKCGQPYALSK